MTLEVAMVSIPVRDQTKAKQWYEEKLGFTTVTDVPFDKTGDRRWIEMTSPSGATRIALFTPDGHENRIGTHSTCIFTADDIYETAKKLKARGITFKQEPTEQDWGVGALFEDLDGNVFCLSKSKGN